MRKCDLIMEGGVTSGVVYPLALVQLAKTYRFACIGGTSAGAIAAAIAAAAEHGRDRGSFRALEDLPKELGRVLPDLFQPAPPLRPVFKAFLAATDRRSNSTKARREQSEAAHRASVFRAIRSLALSYWWSALLGALPALLYPWTDAWDLLSSARNLLGLAGVGLSIVLTVSLVTLLRLRKHLASNLFGLCPGVRQHSKAPPALTDWLTKRLDELAGRKTGDPHLTFGDLKQAGVTLQMMTTNLSMKRPYSLPMTPTSKGNDPEYAFDIQEWRHLFPDTVIDQIARKEKEVPGRKGFYYLPEPDDLPVIVAVRMSLSFPFLLSAVPLYRKDRTFREQADVDVLRRCIFSDGGLTSDFPIHFFDSLLPTRPTFAISLEKFEPRRLRGEDRRDIPANRVHLPNKAAAGIQLPIEPIDDTLGFVAAIVNSARVWQDTLQSVLPGYRERIAHVALSEGEGGLNLTMPPDLVDTLSGYGDLAGKGLREEFDFDEHRWRRFLVAFARSEESTEQFHDAYTTGFDTFRETYADKPPLSYKPVSHKWMNEVRERVKDLAALASKWRGKSLRDHGRIPKPNSTLRITPVP